MSIVESDCGRRGCKHFQGMSDPDKGQEDGRYVCAAFPDGIPMAIAYEGNPHTEPFKGDRGIRFEKDPKFAKPDDFDDDFDDDEDDEEDG